MKNTTEDNSNNTTDNFKEGISIPPSKNMRQSEGKETVKNQLDLLIMKVYVLLFHCYDIFMLLFSFL